jgi:hypothetical protein
MIFDWLSADFTWPGECACRAETHVGTACVCARVYNIHTSASQYYAASWTTRAEASGVSFPALPPCAANAWQHASYVCMYIQLEAGTRLCLGHRRRTAGPLALLTPCRAALPAPAVPNVQKPKSASRPPPRPRPPQPMPSHHISREH